MFVFSIRLDYDDRAMERDQLEAWLQRGLSLGRMGELAGKHPSTISYWLKKYGLVPNGRERHRSRAVVDRKQLEPLVKAGLSIRRIAELLDRSPTAIRHWLKRYGLQTA